jgi:CheY-like chemotaxis protein
MFSVLCPICHFVNPADATRCKACSAAFFEASGFGDLGDAVGITLEERRGLGALSSGWGAEHGPGQSSYSLTGNPAGTASPAPRRSVRQAHLPVAAVPPPDSAPPPEMPALRLIDPIEETPSGSTERAWTDSAPRIDQSIAWPRLTSPDLGFMPDEVAADVPAKATPASDEPDHRLVAKSMARQAARRARMASSSAESQTPASTDVLLLDPDETSRQSLAALLDRFGFQVHEASDVEQAAKMASSRVFAAAFLDIALDGAAHGAGAALCERLQEHRPGSSTAVVLMASQVRPADRVRAALARSDLLLVKPLTRGDVARALESCSVVLPVDERRG